MQSGQDNCVHVSVLRQYNNFPKIMNSQFETRGPPQILYLFGYEMGFSPLLE